MIRYVFYCRFDTTTSSLSIYQRLRCFEVVTENYQEKQNVSDILHYKSSLKRVILGRCKISVLVV